MKTNIRKHAGYLTLILTLLAGCGGGSSNSSNADGSGGASPVFEPHINVILNMGPSAYWPAHEGTGKTLNDLTAQGNHAELINTGWNGSNLDFRGRYEYIQIPGLSSYFGDAFTVGMWMLNRKVKSRHMHQGPDILRAGPVHIKTSYNDLSTGNDGQELELITTVGDTTLDTVIVPGKVWQHLLLTFRDGKAMLYVDGALKTSKAGITYTARNSTESILMGPDGAGWFQQTDDALNGSLREIAFFDRVISDTEIATIASNTRPSVDVQTNLVHWLSNSSVQSQMRLLTYMNTPWYDWTEVDANPQAFKRYLMEAMNTPTLRVRALDRLQKQGYLDGGDHIALVSKFSALIVSGGANSEDRASAAVVLGMLGEHAASALDILTRALEGKINSNGIMPHPIRINEYYLNSLLYALWQNAGTSEKKTDLLSTYFAGPMLGQHNNLNLSDFDEVRNLMSAGQHVEALHKYKDVVGRHIADSYLVQNDPRRDCRSGKDFDYTVRAQANGFAYWLGNGRAYDSCEAVDASMHNAAVLYHQGLYPQAADWLGGDTALMCRPNLQQFDATTGSLLHTFNMGGDNFLQSNRDIKSRSWSVAVDKNGYIHVLGGQHNSPRYHEYIPGAWQENEIGGPDKTPQNPAQLYWVSTNPNDISSFDFVGHASNARSIPSGYLNYMNFSQDNNGELYMYGRSRSFRIQSHGLWKYDANTRKWESLGGQPRRVLESAAKANPDWVSQVEKVSHPGKIPRQDSSEQPFAWAWQPHFYNFNRTHSGVLFDWENRMYYISDFSHGLDKDGFVTYTKIFVYSDDGGQTFHRAGGTKVELPLSFNASPEHDSRFHGIDDTWVYLWHKLINIAHFGPRPYNYFTSVNPHLHCRGSLTNP
ncbi:LamG domain-containing protein [Alcanivorax sp. 1008]|uniref:LamG domain-containing protein n=1 Tax=Alcanivorax sp. 1008 TaxID=2816853 RepID=UPI001DB8E683|nr:LamG domain-containing protein [Alcanivorax sp. 1008]MCC1498155.1 LamG domain-containing protein [Alcanivorax sp. 1008]